MGNILSCGMSISHLCRIPTTEQCTHLRNVHYLRNVLVTSQRTLLIWSLEGKMTLVDIMTVTKLNSSFSGAFDSPSSTRVVGEKLSPLQGSTWQTLSRPSIPSGRQSVVPHQQGQDEGRREEVVTNLVWSIHHFVEYWKQCLSS